MTDYVQTAEALRRMAVQQQALGAAADAFEALGSIDGAIKSANDRRTEAESLLAAAVESLARARNDELAVREQILAQLADANTKADRELANAHLEATQLIDAAKADADGLREAGRAEADRMIVQVNEDLVSVRAELEHDQAAVRDAEEKLANLTLQADDAQKRLDATREAISKLAAGL